MADSTHTTDARIPLLDGVRGLAIALVFATHAGLGWVPGGFGVTTFFFLSGYLITTLLRIEFRRTGTIAFKAYYLRRVLRLWPPLYLFLVISLLLWATGANPWTMHAQPLLASGLHFSNYYEIFGHVALMPGHEVLWSLAIEEHFYVVYPAALWLLLRVDPSRRTAVRVGWCICAAVLAWRIWLVSHGLMPWRTYKASDTRIDSIVFGCLLGCWKNPRIDRVAPQTFENFAMLGLGVLMLLVSFLPRDVGFRETFRYSLQGCALLAIFSAALGLPNSIFVRWLEWRALRWVGGLSYSIYLFHYTALIIAQKHLTSRLGSAGAALVALGGTLVVAMLMERWIEQPCAVLRRRLHHKSPPARQGFGRVNRLEQLQRQTVGPIGG